MLGLAKGKSALAAYKAAGYAPHRQAAVRLLSNVDVSGRLAWLKKSIADKFEWDELDALRWALSVIQTPVGEVDQDHELCQEYQRTDGSETVTVRYKMPCKMAALEKIMRMKGWDKGTKAELQAAGAIATFADEMRRIRSRQRPPK